MAPMKLKTMLVQTFGVTNKEHYGMLWYFLEGSRDGCLQEALSTVISGAPNVNFRKISVQKTI